MTKKGQIVTGYKATGDRNTGDRNTGDRNTGDRNTGYRNTGYRNTGYRNTGDGNCCDYSSGYFNDIEPPIYIFGEIFGGVRADLPNNAIYNLSRLLSEDDEFDYTAFEMIPNSTPAKIEALHQKHIEARKK